MMALNGTSQYLDMGVPTALNGATKVTIAIWFRYNSSGWPAATRSLLTQNNTGQRHVTIQALARGGSGELQVGFSAGTTMISTFFPDNTYQGRWTHFALCWFNAGAVACDADGRAVSLQNPSGSFPAALGSSTTPLLIGAAVGGTTLWPGLIGDVAVWTGWVPDATQRLALWGNGSGGIDYRTVVGVPTPVFYINGSTIPPTDLIGGSVGGVTPSADTHLPPVNVYSDAFFERKFVINFGNHATQTFESEPWLSPPGVYSASPALAMLGNGKLALAYSRGGGHTNGHVGLKLLSGDEGSSWGTSARTWPLDPTNEPAEVSIPHGNLTDPTSSKRSMTLTRIPGIGAAGADRIFIVFNETDFTISSASSSVNVASNVATAVVASSAAFTTGDYCYTTGLSVNVAQGSPVQCTVVDATHVSFPLVTSNGALADGVGSVFRFTNGDRKTWVMYSDDNLATYSTPYNFVGRGTYFTSVGRARIIVRQSDSSLLLEYYGRDATSLGYFAAFARSTDNGATWAHFSNIVTTAGNTNFQEPYCQYVSTTIRCLIRIDAGTEAYLNGGAPFSGMIVRSDSTDHGSTFSQPAFAAWGARHPTWMCRASDGLCVLSTSPGQTAPAGNDDPAYYPVLRVSHDSGITWSTANTVIADPACAGLNMQGDFFLRSDDKILWVYAHGMPSDSGTRMFAGILRDSFLSGLQ